MKHPDGCSEKSKKAAKLERAIYGPKQKGRKWGHLCANPLIANGFEHCKSGPGIFRKIVDGIIIMIM